jgi:hypothetical protein
MQICLESNTLSKEQQLLKFEDLDEGRWVKALCKARYCLWLWSTERIWCRKLEDEFLMFCIVLHQNLDHKVSQVLHLFPSGTRKRKRKKIRKQDHMHYTW